MADDVGDDSSSSAPTERPRDIPHVTWREVAKGTIARIKRDRVSVAAGSLAYHGFLAFFPAIIATLGILAIVHLGGGALHHLTHGIDKALPAGAAGVFKEAVRAATKRQSGTISATVVGIAVALWSSSSAMAVLQQTLDVAYGASSDRKFLARRARGVGLMAVTVALGGCAAALLVFGQPIGSAIDKIAPVGGAAFEIGWTALRWVVAAAVVAVLFSIFYAVGPNRKPRWHWLTPGSVLATAVFLLASLGFSYYISTFGSYAKTYGSFAGVAIFIFWLYLTGLAVLLGAELNAELERRHMRQDGAGRDGTGRDGTARDGTGRDGTGQGHAGSSTDAASDARAGAMPPLIGDTPPARRPTYAVRAGQPQAPEEVRRARVGE